MYYQIIKENGYICGVIKGVSAENANCTEEEYKKITARLENRPSAPSGFCYRLTENLDWVLCEIPVVDIDIDEDTTELV